MQNVDSLQIPARDNWWMSDGSYHNGCPVSPREFKPDAIPEHLAAPDPFQTIEKPKPVYISRDLAKYMKEIVPPDKLHLFEQKIEEPKDVVMEVPMHASENLKKIDPNDPENPPSHLTDESFTLRADEIHGNVETLVTEVDTHLNYLKERLKRMQEFDVNVQVQKERQRVHRPATYMEYNKRGENMAQAPTVDTIQALNDELVHNLMPKNKSLYELQTVKKEHIPLETVERQSGGRYTAMIKRNCAPFRKQGKMLPRSSLVLDGKEESPMKLSVKPMHPEDAHVQAAKFRINEQKLGDEKILMSRQEIIEKYKKKPTGGMKFVEFKSIEDERAEIQEVKLDNKNDDDILTTTAKILEQLKTDENHIVTLMQDYNTEQTRPPVEKWWENKDKRFGEEAKQNRINVILDEFENIGLDVSELKGSACGSINGDVVAENEIQMKDSGC